MTLPSRWLAVAFAISLALRPAPAIAQSGPLVWMPFDASPPGTPADVVLDAANSTPASTKFDIFIHGMWRAEREGPGGQIYQQLSVPGLQIASDFGAPELPVFRFDLGVVTGAPQALLAEAQVISQQVVPGILPWPHIPEAPDTTGAPAPFVFDPAVYADPAGYPHGPAVPIGPTTRLSGTLRYAPGQVHPFHWDPTGMLRVDTHVRYTYLHPGTPVPAQIATRIQTDGSVARLLNGPVVEPFVTWDPIHHAGYYLFLCDPVADLAPLDSLIWQKKRRGYVVTVKDVFDLDNDPVQIRHFIETWYAGTPAAADHYCLIVGDVGWAPTYTSESLPPPIAGTIQTDDYYGDADADGIDDLDEEVHIGRLSYVNAADLKRQVRRILAYEDTPSPLEHFDEAALVAWRSDGSAYGVDTRFENIANLISLWAFTQPLSSTVIDGLFGSSINTSISNATYEKGILCYLGHGGRTNWWSWNWHQDDYNNSNIGALGNGPSHPIVWSIACLTGDLRMDPCMLEKWMQQADNGAVAAYGGTRETYIAGFKELSFWLFRAIFDMGITTHSKAIEFAEHRNTIYDSKYNELAMLLLGDPEMKVRRTRVPPSNKWFVHLPGGITGGCTGCGPIPLNIQVEGSGGAPASGVQVSIYKSVTPAPGAGRATAAPALLSAGPDEVLDNRITGPDGMAHFSLPALTPGTLYVTLTDDEGDALLDSVEVTSTTAVPPPASAALRLTASPTVSRGAVRIAFGQSLERDARIALFDVSGRQVRTLRVTAGAESVTWDSADVNGAPVAAGLYIASMEGTTHATAARILIVR